MTARLEARREFRTAIHGEGLTHGPASRRIADERLDYQASAWAGAHRDGDIELLEVREGRTFTGLHYCAWYIGPADTLPPDLT